MLADGFADNAIGVVEGEEVEDARHHAAPLCAVVPDGLQVAGDCILQPGLAIPGLRIRLRLQRGVSLTAAEHKRQSLISASYAITPKHRVGVQEVSLRADLLVAEGSPGQPAFSKLWIQGQRCSEGLVGSVIVLNCCQQLAMQPEDLRLQHPSKSPQQDLAVKEELCLYSGMGLYDRGICGL